MQRTMKRLAACIHHHLTGDTYQVNTLSNLLAPKCQSLAIYNRMVEQEVGYNAYVEHDEMAVISMSPELLSKNDRINDRPMKGQLNVV